mmetsp:Transcript_138287/g.327542  ORF Transcript_138287/g.327542 Transcript_138287/m.327542 type:complete len:275 (-) Transcript_138287:74-898(-)
MRQAASKRGCQHLAFLQSHDVQGHWQLREAWVVALRRFGHGVHQRLFSLGDASEPRHPPLPGHLSLFCAQAGARWTQPADDSVCHWLLPDSSQPLARGRRRQLRVGGLHQGCTAVWPAYCSLHCSGTVYSRNHRGASSSWCKARRFKRQAWEHSSRTGCTFRQPCSDPRTGGGGTRRGSQRQLPRPCANRVGRDDAERAGHRPAFAAESQPEPSRGKRRQCPCDQLPALQQHRAYQAAASGRRRSESRGSLRVHASGEHEIHGQSAGLVVPKAW